MPSGLGSNNVLNQADVVAGTRTTFIPDIQGSIIGTLDSSSGTPSKRGYLPYGVSASTPGSFAYTAQRIDPETNRTVRRDTIRKGIFLRHDTPSSARRQGASQCN
jgi:hypothetical protein